MAEKPIRVPTDVEISRILSRMSPRDQLIVILALKLGLRASEIANLRIGDIDWNARTVSFVGKGDKPAVLPLTDEVIGYLHRALKLRPTNLGHDFVIWSTRDPTKGVSRFGLYYLVRKAGERRGIRLWPHLLRHKMGSDVARASDIYRAKEALRHARLETTVRYTHLASVEEQRGTFERLDRRHWLVRWLSALKPPMPHFLPQSKAPEYRGETIGRLQELHELHANNEAGIHMVLHGQRGCGASHLLKQLKGAGIYRLDDLRPARERLLDLCQQMHDAGALTEMPKGKSTSAVLKSLIQSTADGRHTLIVDSLTDVSREGIHLLRQLKDHFTVIASIETRQRVKAKDIFFGSHDLIEVRNLDPDHALQLAQAASGDLATTTEDRELFLRRVVAESKGNPRAMMEIIHKEHRRGMVVDASTEIAHEAIQEPLPATPFLSTFLIIAIVSRYGASSVGQPDWKIICIVIIVVIAVLLLIDRVLKQGAR